MLFRSARASPSPIASCPAAERRRTPTHNYNSPAPPTSTTHGARSWGQLSGARALAPLSSCAPPAIAPRRGTLGQGGNQAAPELRLLSPVARAPALAARIGAHPRPLAPLCWPASHYGGAPATSPLLSACCGMDEHLLPSNGKNGERSSFSLKNAAASVQFVRKEQKRKVAGLVCALCA